MSATVASADTTLYRGEPNRNDGANPELRLAGASDLAADDAGWHHRARGANRLVVSFDPETLESFLEDGPIGSARLVLTPTGAQDGAGGHHARRDLRLVAWPSGDTFEEGNGNSAAGDPGEGRGATWNCAVDADISNDVKECLARWTGPRRFGGSRRARPALSYQGEPGPVVFDVRDHVAGGVSVWTIELFDRQFRRGHLAYVSRQGADGQGDLELAPTLILTHDLSRAQPVAENVGK